MSLNLRGKFSNDPVLPLGHRGHIADLDYHIPIPYTILPGEGYDHKVVLLALLADQI